MSRMIAVDWDRHEVRYLLATGRGSDLAIESAGSLPLPASGSSDMDVDLQAGELLREIFKERRRGRAVVLAGIDRSRCEYLTLSLPPADDADLPALVLNQAIRQSPVITDESAVDFVPLGDNPAEPREVLAVAVSSAGLEKLRQALQTAGASPQRVVPRAFAAASRLTDIAGSRPEPVLLVNVFNDEVDLTLVTSGQVRFLRTVRLPAADQPETAAASLVAEIRRTLLIAPAESTAGPPVCAIYVFGETGDHEPLVTALDREDGFDVSLLDPFEGTALDRAAVPHDSGRFAPLLGMLVQEARGRPPAIDLLHPRQPSKPPDRRRPLLVAALVLGALVLVAGGYVWQKLADADEYNRELAAQLKELDALVKKQAKKRDLYAAVKEWEASNIVWLDELRDLSLKFPSGRDAVVLRMSMTPARIGGGIVTMQGLARDPTVVESMERNIRDEFREVTTPRVQQRKQNETYGWHMDTSIFVKKRQPASYQQSLPPSLANLRGTERTAEQTRQRSRQVLND